MTTLTITSGIAAIITAAYQVRQAGFWSGFWIWFDHLSGWTFTFWLSFVTLLAMGVLWCLDWLLKRFEAEATKRAADDKTTMQRIGFIEERLSALEKR